MEAPRHGVTISLSLSEAEGDRACYTISLEGPEGRFESSTELRAGASPSLTVEGAPAWQVETALSFLRILTRDAARGEGWPRRLKRWRTQRT